MNGKLTKSLLKYVRALQQKKYRDIHCRYLVGGVKVVAEALEAGLEPEYLFYTGAATELPFTLPAAAIAVSAAELAQLSPQVQPHRVLAVLPMASPALRPDLSKSLLALDGIADPGNLGTILRLCDWFGVRQVLCTPGSVDVYNPKAVQASMGSIFRVSVSYAGLDMLRNRSAQVALYSASLHGESYRKVKSEGPYILLAGSESHGLSPEALELNARPISIPRVGGGESLNVAVATGILLSHLSS